MANTLRASERSDTATTLISLRDEGVNNYNAQIRLNSAVPPETIIPLLHPAPPQESIAFPGENPDTPPEFRLPDHSISKQPEVQFDFDTGSSSMNQQWVSDLSPAEETSFGTLMISRGGRSKWLGPTAASEWLRDVSLFHFTIADFSKNRKKLRNQLAHRVGPARNAKMLPFHNRPEEAPYSRSTEHIARYILVISWIAFPLSTKPGYSLIRISDIFPGSQL